MAAITYRWANGNDVAALVSLRLAFLNEVGRAGPPDGPLSAALMDYFSAKVPSSEFLASLAELDGAIIATSGLTYRIHPPSAKNLSGRVAYIMNMYTLPAHRGQGIATHLLKLLLEKARATGCQQVCLHALPAGRSLYLKNGFLPNENELRLDL